MLKIYFAENYVRVHWFCTALHCELIHCMFLEYFSKSLLFVNILMICALVGVCF